MVKGTGILWKGLGWCLHIPEGTFFYLFFFSFWLQPQHVEVPRPGIKPEPQQ